MRPFPPSSELQFLVGKEIEEVCLGPFSVLFRLGDGGAISVEHEIEHIEGQERHRYDCNARNGPPLYLHRLLQERITRAEVEPLCLMLTFGSGAELRIFSEIGPYESGQIYASEDRSNPIIF